jgi:rhomboid protease GluP
MAEMNHITGRKRNAFRLVSRNNRGAERSPWALRQAHNPIGSALVIASPPDNAHSWRVISGGGEFMELAGAGKSGPPSLTFALLTALVVVFGCELALGLDRPAGLAQPSVRTMLMLGASNRPLIVADGEWYRMISAPFLHSGLIHLALNGFVLLWEGPLLEGVLGRAWFAAVYGVSAVAGVVMSLALNPPSAVSVGASGALMGMLACLFIVSFHFPDSHVRTRLQWGAWQVLIPFAPLTLVTSGGPVDYGGHLGGFLGGTLMGLILLGNWPDHEPLPRLRWLAGAIGVACLAAAVVTAGKVGSAVIKERRTVALRAMLTPNSQLPRTDAEWKAQLESLASRYPHDPRPRLFRGITLLDMGEFAGAERELRASLADAAAVKDLLPPQVETMVRTNLAIALHNTQQAAEAKVVAAPVCQLDTAENKSMRTRLKRIGVCD